MTATIEHGSAEARPVGARARRPRLRQVELAMALLGVVSAVLVLVDVPGPVRASVVFATVVTLPGWVVVRRLTSLEGAARLVFTVVGSIAVMTVVSVGMVWSTVWHARVSTAVILLVAAFLIVRRPVAERLPTSTPVPAHVPGRLTRRPAVWWIALAVSLVLWIVGVALTRTGDLGHLGLLDAFPAAWYLSVVVAFVVVVAALVRQRAPRGVLASALTLFTVILFASPNAVENAPRLPWVYKHIAVTNYIHANGSVDSAIDLYNRWPGFFSFTASLESALGFHDATAFAGFAEVFFALVDAALVLAIARTVSRDSRWAWTAAIVFTIGDWVGQNYYSPQAFAFMLYLTATLLALQVLGGEPRRAMRRVEAWIGRPARRLGRTVSSDIIGAARSPRIRVIAILVIAGLQAVIAASHQLTPYVAILALLPLFVLGYLRPLWLGLVVIALPVAYLIPNLDYVSSHFGLFSSFDPVANASQTSVSTVGVSEAATLQSHGVVLLTGLVVVLAFAGFIRRILQGHVRATLIVAWLAVAPVMTLFGQTYGGEGKFRIFLFGLPFYAMGVAWLFWSGSPRSARLSRLRIPALVTTLTVLLALFVGTYYQPEASLRVAASDVKASLWLDDHFQPNDTSFSVTDSFPLLVGAHYPNYLLRYAQSTAMTDVKNYSPDPVTNKSLEQLIAARDDGGHTWVVFSDAQTHTALLSGSFTANDLRAIESTVAADSVLRYDRDGVRIYESRR